MKLLIVLSLIACGYAAKLDRTYLPPLTAATAGGSPGFLKTPVGPSGSAGFGPLAAGSGFGQPATKSGVGQQPINSGFSQPTANSGYGQPATKSGVSQQPINLGFSQPTANSGYGQQAANLGFGQQTVNSGFSQPTANSGYGQPTANLGYGQPAGNSVFGQPTKYGSSNSPGFGKSTSGPGFGSQLSGFAPSAQYGQPGSSSVPLDSGFGQVAQNFDSAQNYQRNQPQRAQAAADQSAEILRLDNQNDGETFSYSFETSNGIAAEESGVATNGVQAQGAFSYYDDDGQNFRVTYTADENGYLPQGDHLPTPHPIPEEILKSIEKNAQAAAAGTQEGAYNPDEDNSASAPEQYAYNAPTSNSQRPSGSGSYNQPGSGASQVYSASNSGSSRPQIGAQGFPQSPSQQYGAPNVAGSGKPSNSFALSQQVPSQSYGSPSSGFSGTSSASQSRPNSFAQNKFQSQVPSQQYGAPSRPGTVGGSNSFGPSSNQFPSSGPASQPRPTQYQAPQSGFPSVGRPQGPAQGKPQIESGYQYERPQGSSGASNSRFSNQGSTGSQIPSVSQGPTGQYRPQSGAAQIVGSQGFTRPSGGNAGYPSGVAQGSFSSPSGPSSQASYGTVPSSNTAFGPSSTSLPGSTSPSYFGGNTDSSGAASGQNPSSFGPSTSNAQPSVGIASNAIGFGRPQGSFAGTKTPMANSGYNYNRPGSQAGAGPQTQSGFSVPGSTFGSPRQPPSFSEEEGYKY